MHRVVFDNVELRTRRPKPWPRLLRRVFFGLFLFQCAFVWTGLWLPRSPFPDAHWPDGVLLVFAAAATVALLTRRLPAQNVILASTVVIAVTGGIEVIGLLTGFPFGAFAFTGRIGRELFYPLPWAAPVVWFVVLLNARGVARLILRPWRNSRTYGFQLIGLAALLVAIFDLGLEPYAGHLRQYWSWDSTRAAPGWYGAPWSNFLGWFFTAALTLILATPALLVKKPVKLPPDYRPLTLWLLLGLVLLTAACVNGLWPAAAIIGAQGLLSGWLAFRGAKTEIASSPENSVGMRR
jgi:uncharacterized membrane protein